MIWPGTSSFGSKSPVSGNLLHRRWARHRLRAGDGQAGSNPSRTHSRHYFRLADHSDRTTVWLAFVSIPPVWGKSLGELCCATDSHVDRTFFIEVFLIAYDQESHRAVHHEQAPPKFSSNTCLTKGVLCPEKSIRSIKNSTLQ